MTKKGTLTLVPLALVSPDIKSSNILTAQNEKRIVLYNFNNFFKEFR